MPDILYWFQSLFKREKDSILFIKYATPITTEPHLAFGIKI